MDTPQEIQRKLRENPTNFANRMEAQGRREVRQPASEFVGRLRIGAAQRLREQLRKP